MRNLLLALSLLFAAQLAAQTLETNEVDAFDGTVKKYTKVYNFSKTEVGLLKAKVMRIDDFMFLKLYSTADLGCAGSHKNYLKLLFADGRSVVLKDKADISCENSAYSLFDITNLNTQGITQVRFRQSEYYTDGVPYGTYSLYQLVCATR